MIQREYLASDCRRSYNAKVKHQFESCHCNAANMNVAYLILAHHQPRHLARLIKALDCEWAYFFIHIDQKADVRPFLEALPAARNIVYLHGSRRVRVHWGGMSMVHATLHLIREARAATPHFGRYCLLSGSDFPIKNTHFIYEQFNFEQEFIRIDRQLFSPGAEFHSRLVARYHFPDNPWLNPKTAPVKILPRLADCLSSCIPRNRYKKTPLFHGSQWWALTGRCVEAVLKFLARNADYTRFHKYALLADETFFHSIIADSPFAGNIVHNYVNGPPRGPAANDYGAHYIDWTARGAHPKVLTLSDWPELVRSGALFARKFEESGSAFLTSRLEAAIQRADAVSAPNSLKKLQ